MNDSVSCSTFHVFSAVNQGIEEKVRFLKLTFVLK